MGFRDSFTRAIGRISGTTDQPKPEPAKDSPVPETTTTNRPTSRSRISGGLPALGTAGNPVDLELTAAQRTGAHTEAQRLRQEISKTTDPVDRHFTRLHLEQHLYRSRDIDPNALAEFDTSCVVHHEEMDAICEALKGQWGQLPDLWIYSQSSIRWSKAGDHLRSVEWCRLGIEVYQRWDPESPYVELLSTRSEKALRRRDAKPTIDKPEKQRVRQQPRVELPLQQCIPCGAMQVGQTTFCNRCGNPF